MLPRRLSRDLDCKIDARWHSQAKTFRNACQIKRIHVEYVSLAVARIRLQVRFVAVLGGAIQVIVFVNQLHKLLLDVGQLALGELVLVRLDLLLLEITEEADLMLVDEE